jgi:hypothetical protein
MFRSIAMMVALVMGTGLACSPAPKPTYQFQELEPGSVRLVRITQTIMPAPGGGYVMDTDTLGIYSLADFEASVRSAFRDSALVFLGKFDSLIYPGSGATRLPDIVLVPAPTEGYRPDSVLIRLQIDTILRGTFPHGARPVWLRVFGGFASCGVPFSEYLNKPFFNASSQLVTMADLHVDFATFPGWDPYPDAMWFDGRYLSAPGFPGLRLDITKLYPEYPATGIVARRYMPVVPWKSGAKGYLPDGRVVPGSESDRKTPLPVLK